MTTATLPQSNFHQAAQNVPLLTETDRFKLAELLPDMLRHNPAFGREIGLLLAKDKNPSVVAALIQQLLDINTVNSEVALELTTALSDHKSRFEYNSRGDITSIFIGTLTELAARHPAPILDVLEKMNQDAQYGSVATTIALYSGEFLYALEDNATKQINPAYEGSANNIQAEHAFVTNKNKLFSLLKKIAGENSSAAGALLDNLSAYSEYSRDEALEIVQIIHTRLESASSRIIHEEAPSELGEISEALLEHLPQIAEIDIDIAFQLFDRYKNSSDGRSSYFVSKAVQHLPCLFSHDEERTFQAMEKIVDDGQFLYLSGKRGLFTPFANHDPMRTLNLVTKGIELSEGAGDRSLPGLFLEMAKTKTRSTIFANGLYGLCHDLLSRTQDHHVIAMLSENLSKMSRLSKEQKTKLAEMIYAHPHIGAGSEADKIKEAAVKTHSPLDDNIRQPIVSVLRGMGLAFN